MDLRARILVALGVTAIACTKKDGPSDASSADVQVGPPAPPSVAVDARPAPTEACFTREDIRRQLERPNGMVERPGVCRGTACQKLLDADGCAEPKYITTSCCNPAIGGPVAKDGRCCYTIQPGGCCGRPFIVDGRPRVAALALRDDWSSPLFMTAPRESLARWREDALAEHASIASFARFTLDLLAVGAPPELLLGAADAMRDEIEHARACFSIASALEGKSLGPSPLEIEGSHDRGSLEDIAMAAFEEGCIGETLSSLIASERACETNHPGLKATLEKIADDEARHAVLAWRFVAWALQRGARLEARISKRLEAASALEERAFAEVVRPCATALFDQYGPSPSMTKSAKGSGTDRISAHTKGRNARET